MTHVVRDLDRPGSKMHKREVVGMSKSFLSLVYHLLTDFFRGGFDY